MNIPKINGVLETALYVKDLNLSVAFYKQIFYFETLFSDQRLCALNVSNKQVLLLFLEGASSEADSGTDGVIPPHYGKGNLHIAFSIAKDELNHWRNWLNKNDIKIESEYHWQRGGTSLYFRDPDNHLVELATPGLWSVY